MAALTAARNTRQMQDIQRSPIGYPQKGSTTIFQGALVVLNAGYAAPGTAAASLIAVGRAKRHYANAGADGAVPKDINGRSYTQALIEVEEGIFKFANSGGDLVVAADVGGLCYITDDQTVCHTATGKSVAGKVIQLDSDGVWVRIENTAP